MDGEKLIGVLNESFIRYKDKEAITFIRKGRAETVLKYGELESDSNRLANFFRDNGVHKGDRVILFFPKSLLFVSAHIALQKLGAIAVPLNTGFKHSEMAYFISDAEPTAVLCGPDQEALIKEVSQESRTIIMPSEKPYQEVDFFRASPEAPLSSDISADDPALIIYTSGTTGKPKGAVLTQGNLAHDARNVISTWEITSADRLCHALPLFHVHGLCFALHTCLLGGAHTIMLDAFSPGTTLNVLSSKKKGASCTLFMAVPSMYAKLMEDAAGKALDFRHMRLWTSGSAPLLPKDFARIADIFGKEPVEREGMSETGMNFSNPVQGTRKPGAIGLPLPDLQVRIVDLEIFQDVHTGLTGEIWLKGPSITPGYWRKPLETSKAFVEGWFRSGDLGKKDEDGYYYLTDRIKHIIISGGENISPKEVENVINTSDGVQESAVVGIPDDKWGEKVVAAVVPKKGSEVIPETVKAFCKSRLHDWKCPKEIVIASELPKNTMGKVLKEEVKKLFLR